MNDKKDTEERRYYIDQILSLTNYSLKSLQSRTTRQLHGMFRRVTEDIPRYIDDILKKVAEPGYVGKKYTRSELSNYPLNELADIRNSLGIRKGKKKVTKVEEAPAETIEQIGDILHQITMDELSERIQLSDLEASPDEKPEAEPVEQVVTFPLGEETPEETDHEEFLYEEEIQSAYDGEVPSQGSLKNKGIVNLGHEPSKFRSELVKRMAIKRAIIQTIEEVNRRNPVLLRMSIKEIKELDYNDLITQYRNLQDIIASIPRLEAIEETETKKLGM